MRLERIRNVYGACTEHVRSSYGGSSEESGRKSLKRTNEAMIFEMLNCKFILQSEGLTRSNNYNYFFLFNSNT